MSTLSPVVASKCLPKSPANQRACSSSSLGIRCGGKSVRSRTRVVSCNSAYRSAKSIITIVRDRSIVVYHERKMFRRQDRRASAPSATPARSSAARRPLPFVSSIPLARVLPRWRRQLPRRAADRPAISANLYEREDLEQSLRPASHLTAERRMNTSRLCPPWGK